MEISNWLACMIISYTDPMKNLKEIVEKRLSELGVGAVEAATRAGLERTFLRDIIVGRKKSVRSDKMADLARALMLDHLSLMHGEAVPVDADPGASRADESKFRSEVTTVLGRMVPAAKNGKVAAGLFREVDDLDQSETEFIMVPEDEKYPSARQVTFEVEGDSMNDLRPRPILPGDTVVCTVYEDIEHRVVLRDGMVAVVERSRDSGMMREWSVKQIEIYEDRTEFHPRSTNPKHKPIVINRDFEADDGVQVRVLGLVRMIMNKMPGF